jgi:ATP-dependent DNA helicase RecG
MSDIIETQLSKWLAAGESEFLEFKSSFNDEALETIGAFANAQGGTLLIGAKDSGEICGIDIGKKTLEDIANRIQEATDPRLQPSISTSIAKKKTVVVILVSVVTGSPVSVRGRYFRRVSKSNQRMSHEEIMQRLIAQSGSSWDAYIENNASLGDLNTDLIKEFLDVVREKRRLPIPVRASDEEILKKLELILDNKPTRAALLLFGHSPQSFFPSAFLKMGRFRSSTHIVDDREAYGALGQQLDGAMAWFRERLETEFIITGQPAREVRWEYPLEAIREAVINSLCHRDYTSSAHNQIRLYDDHLEIWNAGSLPAGLTASALFQEHDSIPRNRKIANAFFFAGLIEQWGSGTLRMVEELEAANLPSPRFISELGRFRLVFYRQDFNKKSEFSKRQLLAIEYVKNHGSISNAEFQSLAKISKSTATRDLNLLKESGILISEGVTGRGTVYKLKGSKGS